MKEIVDKNTFDIIENDDPISKNISVNIENKKFDPFLNINTKEDLEKAKKILEKFKND